MEKKIKKNLVIALETFLSTCVCALGVVLFVESGLGSDTIDVFVDGLHRALSISLGRADQLFSVLFLFLVIIFNRKYIGWPTILYTLLIGLVIDLFNLFIIPMELNEQSVFIRFACILLAQICFGISYAISQTVEHGMNTVDAVIYFFVRHYSLSYIQIRTFLDVVFFAGGFCLGGVVGIGTLFSACFTGTITRWIYKYLVQFKNNSKKYNALFGQKEML